LLRCFSTLFAAIIDRAPENIKPRNKQQYQEYISAAIHAVEKYIALEFVCLCRTRAAKWQPRALLMRAYEKISQINRLQGPLQRNFIATIMMPSTQVITRAERLITGPYYYVGDRPAAPRYLNLRMNGRVTKTILTKEQMDDVNDSYDFVSIPD